jgi:hypothetical protein
MLRQDLLNAGIDLEDDEGRVVDFHGQRTTFITGLARAGVAPAAAQRLARHSDINLTMGVYTRLGMEDLASAVNNLPHLRSVSPPLDGKPNSPSGPAVNESQDLELGRIIASWPTLSESIRAAILALLPPAEPVSPGP